MIASVGLSLVRMMSTSCSSSVMAFYSFKVFHRVAVDKFYHFISLISRPKYVFLQTDFA